MLVPLPPYSSSSAQQQEESLPLLLRNLTFFYEDGPVDHVVFITTSAGDYASTSSAIRVEMETSMSYSDIYNKTLQDPRLNIETLYTSLTGIGITATTSTLSTLCSITIIYVILKSTTRMGSVYHRIMFGTSIADILQSVTMAFSTLPMPTDMIYDQFQGLILGTTTTCRIQGFIYLVGYMSGNMYIIFLTYYYFCALHLNMPDTRFRKYFEPFLHAFSILFPLTISILCWTFNFFHPSPLYSFCTVSVYPYWCRDEDDCLAGMAETRAAMVLLLVSIFTVGITGMFGIISLIVIVISMYTREKKLVNMVENTRRNAKGTHEDTARQTALHHEFIYTKRVMKQSVYYVLAYLSSYIFSIMRTVAYVAGVQLATQTWYQVCFVIMRPSQGILNLMIFMYHKIWKLQRQYPNLSYFQATKSILFHGEKEEDRAISSIEIVRRSNALTDLKLASAGNDEFADDVYDESEVTNKPQERFVDMPYHNVKLEDCKVSTSGYESKSAISSTPEPPPSNAMSSKSSVGLSFFMGLSWNSRHDSINDGSRTTASDNKADDSSSVYVTESEVQSQIE